MSVEEESEVGSVGSMPPLILRSEVEAYDESSEESSPGKNIDKISEKALDKGHETKQDEFNVVFNVRIIEWSNDFSISSKIASNRRDTCLVK